MKTTIFPVLCIYLMLIDVTVSDPMCSLDCEDLSTKDAVKNLWKLNKNLSSLVLEYKNDLIRLLSTCSGYEGIIIGQSLLALDKLGGFQSEVSSSCMYIDLIKQSKKMASGIDCKDDYNKAVQQLEKFCLEACENSIRVGLIAAGCPVDRKHIHETEHCPVDDSVADYLENYVKYPQLSKEWIKKLITSSTPNQRAIGLAAVATLTTPTAKFFSNLSNRDEFIEAVKLKGCNKQIPPECCRIREYQLKHSMDALKIAVQAEIQKLLKY